ncbi:MAG: amino acid-binding protein [Alphaproteobacteria bacterium]|nr:amino acid-binding protein [Alphaproteobacteria bacterium]
MHTLLVSALCPDRTGLVASVTGRLFDLGANLGDTTFAVLAGGAEFSCVCDLPDGATAEDVRLALAELPELEGAELVVEPFRFDAEKAPPGRVTHRIVVSGGDRPGLIARLSEVFVQFKANIVRLEAQRVPDGAGGRRYVTRFAVAIPERSVGACLATVANTAGALDLACDWEEG